MKRYIKWMYVIGKEKYYHCYSNSLIAYFDASEYPHLSIIFEKHNFPLKIHWTDIYHDEPQPLLKYLYEP